MATSKKQNKYNWVHPSDIRAWPRTTGLFAGSFFGTRDGRRLPVGREGAHHLERPLHGLVEPQPLAVLHVLRLLDHGLIEKAKPRD